MERFGGASKVEKPKLVPVEEDLRAYASLLEAEIEQTKARSSELLERAENVIKPLSNHERNHLANFDAGDPEAHFAKGKMQPITHDILEEEHARGVEYGSQAHYLRKAAEGIAKGEVPSLRVIRAMKEALHLDEVALRDAKDRLATLERKHNAGEAMSPLHYRKMRELSEDIALRSERATRMRGRVAMFGEVVHAALIEDGYNPHETNEERRSRIEQITRLAEEEGEEKEFDHLNPPELPPLTSHEEMAA